MAEHADAAGRQLGRSAADGAPPDDNADSGADSNADSLVQERVSGVRSATVVGVVAVVALSCLAGWLGFRTVEARQALAQRNTFVEVARQVAVNLTTVDYTTVDADVTRILESSTGTFHDDFQQRSQPFVEVVKQARSKTRGTVTAAGLESQEGDRAHVLVAMSVTTSNGGVPDGEPRGWRMRISVEKAGDFGKVSEVQFVS